METERICPNCRKPLPPDVPLGLCPECLIKSGFPTGTEPGTGGIGRFVPPPVEEIAKLFPQFEILGFIGKGGMGAVYKARQPGLDRFVALKILPPAVASDPGFAERFNREARALARLNHPNIVVVYDFGKAGALHYLVMEFVDGTNLREVEQAGRLSSEQALAIVPQICEALQFAHNEGIVHRDIKPENLLLDKKGRVKITDFGIAKLLDVSAEKVALTGAKDVVGTPHYMAPEQIEKPQTVDHRADIYSLGVVFYEMLTGELPLGKFAPPSKKVQVDVRLDEVVLHTLEKEPERRYQQASQVKTDVETIAGTPSAGRAPAVFPSPAQEKTSEKILLPTFLLAFFFGIFGAHRFYVGKIGTGVVQLLTLGGLGVWATIDWILILCKVFTDGEGRRITNWWHASTSPPKAPKPPKAPRPAEPPAPPVMGGNLFGDVFGGASPMIVAPAVALMVAGFIKLFGGLVILLIGWPEDGGLGDFLLSRAGIFSPFHDGVFFSGGIVLFTLVPAIVMIYGATEMIQCRNYAWAIAASAVGILFCSTIGLPVGIWALIVLLLPNVRDRFENPSVPLAREKWFWILGGTAAAALLLFLIFSLAGFIATSHPAVATGPSEVVTTTHTDNPTQPGAESQPSGSPPSAPPVAPVPAPAAGIHRPPEPMPSPDANPASTAALQAQPVQPAQPVEPVEPVQPVQPVEPIQTPLPQEAAPETPAMASPTPPPGAQKQLLELQLNEAQMELTNVEAQYSVGMATSADVDSAKVKVEILQAELSGNAVRVAEVELAAARRILDQKTQLRDIGRASAEEVEKARSELAMTQVKLREAQDAAREANAQARAARSQPSFTVVASGTPQLAYQWYSSPNNSSQPPASLPGYGAATTAQPSDLEFRWVARKDEGDLPADVLPVAEPNQPPMRILRDVILTGDDVRSAGFTKYEPSNKVITIFWDDRGEEKFARATAQNVGRRLAIVWNGCVMSAPKINMPITSGACEITGHFTDAQANELLDVLNHRIPQTGASGGPGYAANISSAPVPTANQYPLVIAYTGQSATNNPVTVANPYQGYASKPDAPAASVHETDDVGDATDFSRIFLAAPGGKLTMNVDRGDVHITGGPQSTVEIHVRREVSGESNDSENAKKILKEEHVTLKQNGNEISITAQNPPSLNAVSHFFGRHPNLDAHYEITVPRKFEVQSETAGGDISAAGIEKGASIKTLGGSLNCKDIGGDVDGQTMGGDVHATECRGGLQLETMGGSITIDGFTGPAIHATTSGGSVSANFIAAPREDCELKTMGGNVTVRLPGSAAVTLDGHTQGGSVQTDFPVKIENGFGNDSVSGPVNGGGPVLKISTEGGNIEVLKR